MKFYIFVFITLLVLPQSAGAEYVEDGELSFHRCPIDNEIPKTQESYLQSRSQAERTWLELSAPRIIKFRKAHSVFDGKSFFFHVNSKGIISNLNYDRPTDDVPPRWAAQLLANECHLPTPVPLHGKSYRKMNVVLKEIPAFRLEFNDD